MNDIYRKEKTNELKAKAVRSAGVNFIAQFMGIICQTIGAVVLARLLEPKDFGLVAMVTAVSLWLMNFGVNGFTEFIIQKQHIGKEEVNSIFWLHLFLATSLAFGFTLCGFFLVDFYGEPALKKIAAAISISFIINALFTTHFALLKRDMKFTAIAISELVAIILSVLFSITLALGGMGYWAVVGRQLAIPGVTVIAAWIVSPWRPDLPRYLSKSLPGFKYAVQVYSNISLGFLMKGIDKVLLGRFYGPIILGYYDRAYYIFSAPTDQLLTPLHSVALASFSRLKHDKEQLSAYFTKVVSIIAFPGALVALVMTLSAKDIVLALLGEKWIMAGEVVMAFAPGIAATFLYGTHSWLHLALGTPNRWFKWNLFVACLTIIIFSIAAPFGAVAMAFAYSARTYALVIPALWYAGLPIQFSIRGVMRSIWAYFFSAISVYILWLYLYKYWMPLKEVISGLGPLNRIIIVSSIVSIIYIVLVIFMQGNLKSIHEIRSLIKIIFNRGKK